MQPNTPQDNTQPNSSNQDQPAGQASQPGQNPYSNQQGQTEPSYQQAVAGKPRPNRTVQSQDPQSAGQQAAPGYVQGEERLSKTTKKSMAKDPHNPLSTLRPGEKIVCEVKRHPFSLFGTYFGAGTIMAITIAIGYGALPKMLTNYSSAKAYGIATLIVLCVAIIVGMFVWVARIIHKGNRWIVTSDSIIQIRQVSLFSKNNSQLGFGSLEDLTAEKNGILAHMFNFGSLRTQSAGEVSKFRFPYCPQPNYYASLILRAKEAYEDEQRQVHLAQPYVPSGQQSYYPPQ